MSDAGLICGLIGVGTGGAFSARGWFLRSKGSHLDGIQAVPISNLAIGRAAAISGNAKAVLPMTAAVSGKSCVYYEVATRVHSHSDVTMRTRYGPTRNIGADALLDVTEYAVEALEGPSTQRQGGFLVDDGTGTAFVAPTRVEAMRRSDYDRTSSLAAIEEMDTLSTERRLEPGDPVCAVGVPRTIAELLDSQRAAGPTIPAEILAWLAAEQKAGSALPCFFADDCLVAADTFDRYQESLTEGADGALSAGAILFAIGAASLVGAFLGYL